VAVIWRNQLKVEWQAIDDLLVDPVDRSPLRVSPDRLEFLSESGRRYSVTDGQPVLLPADGFTSGGWRFDPIMLAGSDRPKPIRRWRRLFKGFQRAVRRGVGGQGAGDQFVDCVGALQASGSLRVLIIGGATVGDGSHGLVASPNIDVISFDVYATSETTFVGDAHRIPLADASVSGVWVQAVLEHVYRPEDVVAEIVRVLQPGGFVYAETPFLQPVHEGAYDYLRVSHSGHRLLFARFDEITSGPLGGPAAMVNLGIRGFVGGLTRSRSAARAAYAVTQPLALLDRFVADAWRVDYCTGTYFLGRLSSEVFRSFDASATYRGLG
jgi:SAM-dependent methyltransferase